MKILFLLFPLILLLVQGAAGIKNACQLLGGYCAFWKCRPPTRRIGNCSAFTICCKRVRG
ncbi:gallinacin-1-like [Corvus moneduloides]|uniref:gallinacin-1-like n=2 Tax=Corvus TaxID=30420 RepID=UPI00136311F0|nr:gallinacin-1-like [Corvus moneduloides]